MAQKLEGWKSVVYYGTAGSAAGTLISANVTDVDMGGADLQFVDLPSRGDGSTIPQKDEYPVKDDITPKFTMVYHDTDTHMANLLSYAKARTLKAYKIMRKLAGEVEFNGDGYLSYTSPGAIAEGQPVEFTIHPNAQLRAWTRAA